MQKYFEGHFRAKRKENSTPKSSEDLYILIWARIMPGVKTRTTDTQLCLLPFDTSSVLYSSGSNIKVLGIIGSLLAKTDALALSPKDSGAIHLRRNTGVSRLWNVQCSEQGVCGSCFKKHSSTFLWLVPSKKKKVYMQITSLFFDSTGCEQFGNYQKFTTNMSIRH